MVDGVHLGANEGSEPHVGATGRVLIDARGSIDSRTFDTEGRVSPLAKEEGGRHEPLVDLNGSQARLQSKSGQGSADAPLGRIVYTPKRRRASARPRISLATQSRVTGHMLRGHGDLWQPQGPASNVPVFFKVVIPVIAVLLATVVYLAISRM